MSSVPVWLRLRLLVQLEESLVEQDLQEDLLLGEVNRLGHVELHAMSPSWNPMTHQPSSHHRFHHPTNHARSSPHWP